MTEYNRKEVLIIEDDVNFSYVLGQFLLVSPHFQENQVALTAVTSGEEAVVAVREHTPDLFVLDMRLDNAWLTALEFAAFAQRFPELASVPIVILTGFPVEEITSTLKRHNVELASQGYQPIEVAAIIQKGNWDVIEATVARVLGLSPKAADTVAATPDAPAEPNFQT